MSWAELIFALAYLLTLWRIAGRIDYIAKIVRRASDYIDRAEIIANRQLSELDQLQAARKEWASRKAKR